MKRLRAIAIGLLILASLGAKAQSKDVYRSPKTSIWVGFNSGHYKQDGYPSLKSNIGGSVMLNSSFWIIKPGNQRFKLGIEAVSYTHLTLPTTMRLCRSRWSPYH